jgi:hypothetical protein
LTASLKAPRGLVRNDFDLERSVVNSFTDHFFVVSQLEIPGSPDSIAFTPILYHDLETILNSRLQPHLFQRIRGASCACELGFSARDMIPKLVSNGHSVSRAGKPRDVN